MVIPYSYHHLKAKSQTSMKRLVMVGAVDSASSANGQQVPNVSSVSDPQQEPHALSTSDVAHDLGSTANDRPSLLCYNWSESAEKVITCIP